MNQLGTLSSKAHCIIGNVLPLFCVVSKHDQVTWIFDSGAIDHVISSLKYFASYREIIPIVVKLPNGQQTTTTFSGTIQLTNSLFPYDVLYLPHFTFNLVSISKLASFLRCQLIFSVDKCLIQDIITKKMSGTVDAKDGLYKLKIPSRSMTCVSFVNIVF